MNFLIVFSDIILIRVLLMASWLLDILLSIFDILRLPNFPKDN
jgi:hypothetical protein